MTLVSCSPTPVWPSWPTSRPVVSPRGSADDCCCSARQRAHTKCCCSTEPERALDTEGKQWLTSLVVRSTDAGAAVVLATHHPPLLDIADSVLESFTSGVATRIPGRRRFGGLFSGGLPTLLAQSDC